MTIDQLFAHLQAKIDRLASRLDEIHELVAGRTKENHTVEEAGQIFGRSAYTVRRWISEGKLKAFRVIGTGERGRLLINREELQRLIDTGRGENL